MLLIRKLLLQNVSHFVINVKHNLFSLAYCVCFVIFLFGRLLSFLVMTSLIFCNIYTRYSVEVSSIFYCFPLFFPSPPDHCEPLVVHIHLVKDLVFPHAPSKEKQLPVCPGLVHIDISSLQKSFQNLQMFILK